MTLHVSTTIDHQLEKAFTFHQADELTKAKQIYQDILLIEPTNHRALNLLGILETQLENFQSAIDLLRGAIFSHSVTAAYYVHLGAALYKFDKHREAIANCDLAILLKPNIFDAYCIRGNCYIALDEHHQALASFQQALKIDASSVNVLYNCATTLYNLRRFKEAVAYYDQVLTIDPNFVEALKNKALTLLHLGEYRQGFALFEHRWRQSNLVMPAETKDKPLWIGEEAIADKTILLHSEQGLGDTIQFCRYATDLAKLGAKVILSVEKPLAALLTTLQGVDIVHIKGTKLPAFDYHCPMLSLPFAFRTTAQSVPSSVRYLQSEKSKRVHWANKLGVKKQLRIGIAWSGGLAYGADSTRSIPLAEFLSYLPAGFQYISLQKDVRPLDQGNLEARPDILHFGAEQKDFSDTAAIIDLLDLVISVDTSIGHLSAALGKPTATLISFLGDWRWIEGQDDSPWYPNVKLFRQDHPKDWSSAFTKLRTALFHHFYQSKT